MSLQPPFLIAIDIDEVLCEFLPTLCTFYNSKHNTNYTLSHFHSYQFNTIWGGSIEETTMLCYAFFKTEEFRKLKCIKNSYDVLVELKRKYNIEYVIVTSRQVEIKEETSLWIATNYPNLFKEIAFGHHYGKDDTYKSKSKVEMCVELNASILIDDSLVYAKQCAEKLEHVLLFDLDYTYNWNKVCDNEDINYNLKENIKRVKDWDQVAIELEKMLVDYKL